MQCRYLLHKHILMYNSMERVRSIDNHRIKGLYDSVKKWYIFVFVSIVYPSDDFRVSTSVKVIIECYYNAIYYNAISVFKNKELSNTFLNSSIKPSLFQFIWQWMCCVVFSCIVCDWTVFLVMSFVYWKWTKQQKMLPQFMGLGVFKIISSSWNLQLLFVWYHTFVIATTKSLLEFFKDLGFRYLRVHPLFFLVLIRLLGNSAKNNKYEILKIKFTL